MTLRWPALLLRLLRTRLARIFCAAVAWCCAPENVWPAPRGYPDNSTSSPTYNYWAFLIPSIERFSKLTLNTNGIRHA